MKRKNRIQVPLIIGFSLMVLLQACIIPSISSEPKSTDANWTLMMYFNGDNKLQSIMELYLNYIQDIPYEPMIQLIVLIDGKPVEDTKLYHIMNNQLIELDWEEESDMDDAFTLEQFIQTARSNYPASHYGLFIESNKGSAWQGLCYDEHGDGTMITMPELQQLLDTATNQGTSKIDILGIESCMTGNTELAYQVKDYVNILIAGPECGLVAPAQGIGFPYQAFINELVDQPEMTPAEVSESIVENFLCVNEPSMKTKTNLLAVDLSKMNDLAAGYDELAEFFIDNIDQVKPMIYASLDQTKIFGEFWGINYMIEPDQFLENLNLDDTEYQSIKDQIQSQISSSIIAKNVYPGDPVNSISLYLPRNTPDYNLALRYDSGILPSPYEETLFAMDTQWDEFLKTLLGIAYNTAPEPPEINGPGEIYKEEATEFQFKAHDPDGDELWYYVDWGDETTTTWDGPYASDEQITISHTYQQEGSYSISAKVKDTSDAESEMVTLPVTISKTKFSPSSQIKTVLIGKITDIEEDTQGGIRFLPQTMLKIVIGSEPPFIINMLDETYGGYPCCAYIQPEDFKGIITPTFILGCWFTSP